MIEEWRDIKYFEGIYQVSSLGRVRSLDRIDSVGKQQYSRILKDGDNGGGYRMVVLTKNAKSTAFKVHRLVAQSFVSNPENKHVVNHKDENKSNNNVDNLEWVTHKENVNYGTNIERRTKNQSKQIKVIYRDNTFEIWESQTVFAREFKVNASSINSALNGRMKTYKGMKFEYA